jgi:hypothetical protein
MHDESTESAAQLVCDFCGAARSPLERNQVVWNRGVTSELVLADVCSRCADDGDRLLDLYGGRGRGALRIARRTRVSPAPARRTRTLGRVLLYLLAGLASFVLVTLITSLR